MIVQMKQIILFLWICCFTGHVVFSQSHSSRNNYTGDWQTPASWNPTWPVPQTNNIGYDIIIYGYITVNGSLSFSGFGSDLIINDTLVVYGDLILENYNDITVNNNGILIVRGNLTIGNHSEIRANGYLIITEDIIKSSSTNHGSFRSDDNPVKVFIGGTISSAGITTDPDYPVLNCTAPITTPYPNSTCSYGNMTDIINDPIYPFFQSTCTIATPTITAGGSTTFCAGGSVTLTSSEGATYLWSTGATTESINITTAGSYTVRVTNASGCQSALSAATVVNVNALPVVNAGTDATIPNGTSTTIDATVTGTGPFTYSWSPSAQLMNALIEDPTTINLITTTVYTLTATSTTTSCSETDAVTITIIGGALSSIPSATPEIICAGADIQLYALASGGSGSYTYTWTSVPAGFTSTIANPIVNPMVNTTYNVAVFDGFTTVNSQVAVTVNALPVRPAITAVGPTTFCDGGSVILTSGAGTSYLWSNGAITQNINVTTAGSYTVQVTNASGCRSAASAATIVTVNALPLVNITSSSSSMCVNDLRTLTGSPAGGTFVISDGPGTISGNILSATGKGNISLEYIYTDVCANKATQSIIVNENPVAIAGHDQELNYVFETQMKAELSSSETGEWSLISGSGNLSDIHSPTTSVTELSTGENIFLWKVQNGNCESSATVKITVYNLFIPSVITPNDDGKNDHFKISGSTDKIELVIFNRWGNVEYTNDNYLNDWDGKNNSGAELPNDTYFFVVKFKNGEIKKGSVLIKR